MYAPHRLTSAACARVLLTATLVAWVLASLLLAVPVSAADRVVSVTAAGLAPATLEVRAGDRVTFNVTNDLLGSTRLKSTGGPWSFDKGVSGDVTGAGSYTVPEPLSMPGTYSYTATRGDKTFPGSVVVPGPATSASPAAAAAASASASPSVAAAQPPAASKAPAPSPPPPPTGGSGSAALPPLTGGFGSVGAPAPMPGGIAPAPTLALPLLPEQQQAFGPLPATAPAPTTGALTPTTGALTATAVAGDLAGQPTLRGYGLPAAIAAVLAGGVLSLLVRLLVADPAAARVRRVTGPTPVAAAD